MVTGEERMKKGYLNTFWNGVHLDEGEKEYIRIRGSRMQQKLEKRE
jgi:hypothetical protein